MILEVKVFLETQKKKKNVKADVIESVFYIGSKVAQKKNNSKRLKLLQLKAINLQKFVMNENRKQFRNNSLL